MKKFSGGVLFSALSLLLLLSFFLLLFLEDYKLKGEFQIKLARYYVALSMKEWVEEQYLSGSEKNFFAFKEGTVELYTYHDTLEKMEYIVQVKDETFKFYGEKKEEVTEITDSTVETEEILESSSEQTISESSESIPIEKSNSEENSSF